MLLGIFLYNGTMFYELKNGTLVETKDAQGNFDLTQVLGNKYLEDVDSEKCVIVDTYSNRCFLISKDLLHHGVSEEVYHKMLDSDETDSNKSSEEMKSQLSIRLGLLTLMLAKIKKQLKSTISCLSMCVSILRKP